MEDLESETIEIELDPSRAYQYEILQEMIGKRTVDNTIETNINELITELYDRREELKEQKRRIDNEWWKNTYEKCKWCN